MRGILDLLAKAKLVQLSDDERVLHMPAEPAESSYSESPETAYTPLPVTAGPFEEGIALDELFAQAGLPPTAFPAEKLLRLLDGLRAMDATTRKTAVLAMDAADDTWQISDAVGDAQRKVAALNAYKQRLNAEVVTAEQQVAAELLDKKAALEQTTGEIRTQITELERLLERAIAQSAQEATNLEAGLRANREAVARELRRMDKEIERLGEIPASFNDSQ